MDAFSVHIYHEIVTMDIAEITSGCSGNTVNWSSYFTGTTIVSGPGPWIPCPRVLGSLGPWVPGPQVLGFLVLGSLGPRSSGPWVPGPRVLLYSIPTSLLSVTPSNIQTYYLARAGGGLMMPCTSIFMYIYIKHVARSIYRNMSCAENNYGINILYSLHNKIGRQSLTYCTTICSGGWKKLSIIEAVKHRGDKKMTNVRCGSHLELSTC